MERSTIFAVIAILVVAGLAWLMRRGGAGQESPGTALPPTLDPPDEVEDAEDADESEGDPHEVMAITSDGWAFVPDRGGVQVIPPAEHEDAWVQPPDPSQPVGGSGRGGSWEAPHHPASRRHFRETKPGEHLSPGDALAARVKRGAPGVDPWRLEVLGRDREYRHWPFETEDAARAALDLLSKRVVRAPRAADDETEAIGEADFALARAEYEATEAELASEPEDEGPEPR